MNDSIQKLDKIVKLHLEKIHAQQDNTSSNLCGLKCPDEHYINYLGRKFLFQWAFVNRNMDKLETMFEQFSIWRYDFDQWLEEVIQPFGVAEIFMSLTWFEINDYIKNKLKIKLEPFDLDRSDSYSIIKKSQLELTKNRWRYLELQKLSGDLEVYLDPEFIYWELSYLWFLSIFNEDKTDQIRASLEEPIFDYLLNLSNKIPYSIIEGLREVHPFFMSVYLEDLITSAS